jgi:hypothetical protein
MHMGKLTQLPLAISSRGVEIGVAVLSRNKLIEGRKITRGYRVVSRLSIYLSIYLSICMNNTALIKIDRFVQSPTVDVLQLHRCEIERGRHGQAEDRLQDRGQLKIVYRIEAS